MVEQRLNPESSREEVLHRGEDGIEVIVVTVEFADPREKNLPGIDPDAPEPLEAVYATEPQTQVAGYFDQAPEALLGLESRNQTNPETPNSDTNGFVLEFGPFQDTQNTKKAA